MSENQNNIIELSVSVVFPEYSKIIVTKEYIGKKLWSYGAATEGMLVSYNVIKTDGENTVCETEEKEKLNFRAVEGRINFLNLEDAKKIALYYLNESDHKCPHKIEDNAEKRKKLKYVTE